MPKKEITQTLIFSSRDMTHPQKGKTWEDTKAQFQMLAPTRKPAISGVTKHLEDF
ncbi:MAG TPA: hypothetical protein VGA95_11715 [Thermodesulfobacteriota bacterium]